MAVGIQVWSQTAATNATVDTNINFAEGQAPSSLNDSCRAMMASAAKWRDDNNGTLITSGSSSAFTLVTNQIEGALTAGYTVTVQFHAPPAAAATLAVDGLAAKQIQLVPGSNLLGSEWQTGSVQRLSYETSSTAWQIQSGLTPTVSQLTTAFLPYVTNSLSGDVACNNTSNYFDGPSCAQGTTGVWLAIGQITMTDTGGSAALRAKLWDGTTVIDSAQASIANANAMQVLSLSGVLQNPAGNIKISGNDPTLTSGVIKFNVTGNSKDSTLTVVRIG